MLVLAATSRRCVRHCWSALRNRRSQVRILSGALQEAPFRRGSCLERVRSAYRIAGVDDRFQSGRSAPGPADYPSLRVSVSLGGPESCADARFLASFLACFSCRRSRSLRSRLSFAIVVFLLPLEAMSGIRA
jgi:hypothetical protein